MTTAQLISELEKPRKNYPQGVLTWEVGDVALIKENDGTVTARDDLLVVHVDYEFDKSLSFDSEGAYETLIDNCIHSPDDPRLLGRCLRELEKTNSLADIQYAAPSGKIVFISTSESRVKNSDTLLEAALKALLAKVEGEQS